MSEVINVYEQSFYQKPSLHSATIFTADLVTFQFPFGNFIT